MQHRRDASVITLFSEAPVAVGPAALGPAAAQHARVRRVAPDDAVRVVDGRGRVGTGRILRLSRDEIDVSLEDVADVPRPQTLEMLVPVADRDRMLLAAEKCVELQVTTWQPVWFGRSRSVHPRGEGEKFRDKLRARMIGALEQSGGAWLPDARPEMEAAEAWSSSPAAADRIILDRGGAPIGGVAGGSVAAIVGPEGGFEPHELEAALTAGWRRVSIADTTLRFETAIIAAAAILRDRLREPQRGG